MIPSHAIPEAPFSIERMSFGERSLPPESTATAPETASVAAGVAAGVAEEGRAGRLYRQFADDIARALGAALHELDRQRDIGAASSTLKLAAQVEFLGASLDRVRQKTEELVATVSEHGAGVSAVLEKCDGLAVQLQQAEGAREAATVSWRQQSDDMSARVDAVVERMDRHAEALRSVVDFRNRVTGALEQVAGLLAGLQETAPPPASLESL